MNVIISNLTALDNHRAGVGFYTSELIRSVRQASREVVLHTFPPPRWQREWWDCQSRRYERLARQKGPWAWVGKKVCGRFLALAGQVMPRDPSLADLIRRHRCHLYHEPNYFPLECDLPTVVSVHDLTMLLHPEFQPAHHVAMFEKHFEQGLRQARHLIAISEHGKQQIVEHLGWSADRVSVTYMGVRPGLRPVTGRPLHSALQSLNLSEGYLLHVGTLEPRKNLLMLVKAYCTLPASLRERHPLVLVGGKGWNSDQLHEYLEVEGRHRGVRWLGYVADDNMAALYSGARALLYPTFYEGFGMPTIEMMACGGAVIASTAGAVAETVGHKAALIDPGDVVGWREAMLRVCTDEDWWQHLRQDVRTVAASFTWEQCARQTLEAYRRALGHESCAA